MKKNNQSGQSTIEFIFCFIFAVSLIILVFNTSLNYAAGYVTHYATFMASRVFLTQDSNMHTWNAGSKSKATQAATATFNKYKLDIVGIKSQLQFTPAVFQDSVSTGEYLMIGVYTQFERKMDLVGQITGQQKLELISESYLGREPVRGICASRTCQAITGQTSCNGENQDITLFDDGC